MNSRSGADDFRSSLIVATNVTIATAITVPINGANAKPTTDRPKSEDPVEYLSLKPDIT